MKLSEPWYKKLWKLFFQSAEDYRKEMIETNQAQKRYYKLLGNIKPNKRKRRIRNI
jgi:hypothetical protein